MVTIKPIYAVAAGAVVLAVAYRVIANPGGTGARIGSAAVDLVDGVVGGVVNGAGELVGVPRTNETECERAMREGRTWDASFACPAKRFLSYLFGG